MDETPICFEMIVNSTLAKKGSRNVAIRSFGSDRIRVTAVLFAGANGKKFHL